MAIQGVILDVDGTLILSNDCHAQAWVDALATFGHEVPFERVRPLIGMGGDRVLPTLVPGLNDEDGEGKAIVSYRRKLMLSEFTSKVQPAKGARDLVLHMQQQGLQLVVASSASPEELGTLLKLGQVEDLLTNVTSSGEVESSKPAPDIVEAALDNLGLPADQVVMIGDSPYDMEAAGKAGVRPIAFRCGGFPEDSLQGAIAFYDDPADLLAHYETSLLSRVAQPLP